MYNEQDKQKYRQQYLNVSQRVIDAMFRCMMDEDENVELAGVGYDTIDCYAREHYFPELYNWE